ncbi:MAG: hypothetical protein ACE5OQ_08640 [Woeseia sp.]
MLYRWCEHEGDATKGAWQAFMNIGDGKTASSPLRAKPLVMFRANIDEYVMNRDRLLDSAVGAALDLSCGYSETSCRSLEMPGRSVWQETIDWLDRAHQKGRLTPHDVTTGTQLATIVTGGDIEAGTSMSENDICALERKGFISLAKTKETRARIEFMLEHGRPLRNWFLVQWVGDLLLRQKPGRLAHAGLFLAPRR